MFLDEFPPQILSISCNFLKLNTFFSKKKILKILNDSPSFLELNFFLKHICLLTAQLMIQITAKKSFKRRDKSGI